VRVQAAGNAGHAGDQCRAEVFGKLGELHHLDQRPLSADRLALRAAARLVDKVAVRGERSHVSKLVP